MKYKMCASVAQKTPRSANTVLCKALKICDYAELRLDFLKPKDVPKALELSKRQLSRTVCTLRPKSEGGVFEGTEKERLSIMKLIAEYNPFLLDIEYSTMPESPIANATKLVLAALEYRARTCCSICWTFGSGYNFYIFGAFSHD